MSQKLIKVTAEAFVRLNHADESNEAKDGGDVG